MVSALFLHLSEAHRPANVSQTPWLCVKLLWQLCCHLAAINKKDLHTTCSGQLLCCSWCRIVNPYTFPHLCASSYILNHLQEWVVAPSRIQAEFRDRNLASSTNITCQCTLGILGNPWDIWHLKPKGICENSRQHSAAQSPLGAFDQNLVAGNLVE